MDFPRGFDRTNLQQICAQQCKNRKAASANLMQLTKEITHNLKPRRRQSKKNFNPCACASAGAAAATSAATSGTACVDDSLLEVESRVCLDGQKAISATTKHPKPRRGSTQVPSRGPALSPADGCYAMTDLCSKLGYSTRPIGECECKGCKGICSSVGPHVHRNITDCPRDYCNYPCFKPLAANLAGNLWSGTIHTNCVHPEPCKADCFEHVPPRNWNNYMHRKG